MIGTATYKCGHAAEVIGWSYTVDADCDDCDPLVTVTLACGCQGTCRQAGALTRSAEVCQSCYHAAEVGARPAIGATIDYVRYGKMPASGRSRNHRDGYAECGVSVYQVVDGEPKYTGWYFDIVTAPAYAGKGEVVGFGSDGEPLIKPLTCRRAKKYDR